MISDPALIQAEIDKRLAAAMALMITAFSVQLLTIDELRTRMTDLAARETKLRNQIQAVDAQAADRGAYLKPP